MDDSDEEAAPAPTNKPDTPTPTPTTSDKQMRTYTISITYDRYHNTPRLWLAGVDSEGKPLTNDQIFEDIMSDYINKTVTIEDHPHLGTRSFISPRTS